MKHRILAYMAALVLAGSAQATLYTYDFDNLNVAIPDGNANGLQNSQSVPNSFTLGPNDTAEIVDVNVRLNISGTYNGDLYGYLVHSTGFAVLLNRVGRTGTDAFGYANGGFDVTLDGQAGTYDKDIHMYNAATPAASFNSGKLTGSWLEDGRTANPNAVTDASARNALLSNFNGLDANGTWSLFLADVVSGGPSTLVSWGLDLEVVPEPTTWALVIFGGVAGVTGLCRRWKARRVS